MRGIGMSFVALAIMLPGSSAGQVAPPPARFFDSDGVRIRYVVRGEGAPVLLVHGLAVSVELNWGGPGILDSLASRYRVIALDLRGHGLSDKLHDPDAYGVRFVDDLVNLLDHLEVDRAHVVGYSLGAAITLKFLTTHPDRVGSAVLGGGGWQDPRAEVPAWRGAWLEGFERAARDSTSVMDVLRLPDWPPLPPEVEAAINRNDPLALAAVLRGARGLGVTEAELRANTVPAIAVVGADDVQARGDVERMAGIMANLEVASLPGANHVTAIGHPGFVEAIVRFLERQ